jgi:hypothetical protein
MEEAPEPEDVQGAGRDRQGAANDRLAPDLVESSRLLIAAEAM